MLQLTFNPGLTLTGFRTTRLSCWRRQVQHNLLSSSVCLLMQRFVFAGLSMLRNISERPKREREKVLILS